MDYQEISFQNASNGRPATMLADMTLSFDNAANSEWNAKIEFVRVNGKPRISALLDQG